MQSKWNCTRTRNQRSLWKRNAIRRWAVIVSAVAPHTFYQSLIYTISAHKKLQYEKPIAVTTAICRILYCFKLIFRIRKFVVPFCECFFSLYIEIEVTNTRVFILISWFPKNALLWRVQRRQRKNFGFGIGWTIFNGYN